MALERPVIGDKVPRQRLTKIKKDAPRLKVVTGWGWSQKQDKNTVIKQVLEVGERGNTSKLMSQLFNSPFSYILEQGQR